MLQSFTSKFLALCVILSGIVSAEYVPRKDLAINYQFDAQNGQNSVNSGIHTGLLSGISWANGRLGAGDKAVTFYGTGFVASNGSPGEPGQLIGIFFFLVQLGLTLKLLDN